MIEPKIDSALSIFLDAFYDLSSERAPAMSGTSPIPITSVIMYAKHYCVSDAQIQRMIRFVKAMDVEHVNLINSKQKK